jgi:hypothetical protein
MLWSYRRMKIIITVEVPDGAAVSVGNEPATAAPRAKATKPTPPAATLAAAPAQAPAAAPPAQSPEVSTVVTYIAKTGAKKGQVGTGADAVNFAVLDVASRSRDKALAVLATFKVTRTPELKAEQYQAVIDAMEEELAKIDAASVQASLV